MTDAPPYRAPLSVRGLVLHALPVPPAALRALLEVLRGYGLLARPLVPGARLSPDTDGLRIGLLAAGRRVPEVLRVAAAAPGRVAAVVACNGRPDQAAGSLPQLHAPTLLVVGTAQCHLLALARAAMPLLGGDKRLEIVPGRFAEAAAIDALAQLAGAWFEHHLSRPPRA